MLWDSMNGVPTDSNTIAVNNRYRPNSPATFLIRWGPADWPIDRIKNVIYYGEGYMTTADKQTPARGINVKKPADTMTVRGRWMRLMSDVLRQTPLGWVLLYRFV